MEKSLYSSKGRISRRAYWVRWLISTVITIAVTIASSASTGADGRPDPLIDGLGGIVSLLANLFMIIQGVKRMHDVDKSGWYILVPLYNFVLVCRAGTTGPNRFGDDPSGAGSLEDLAKTFE